MGINRGTRWQVALASVAVFAFCNVANADTAKAQSNSSSTGYSTTINELGGTGINELGGTGLNELGGTGLNDLGGTGIRTLSWAEAWSVWFSKLFGFWR